MKTMQSNHDSTASSATSKRRGSLFGQARAALSSLSQPIETWGESDVPVLSPTQIVPRRTRPALKQPHRVSDGKKGGTSSHRKIAARKLAHKRGSVALARVGPIRPLSIASVSTFGAWMPDQDQLCTNDDIADSIRTLSNTGSHSESGDESPVRSSSPETQCALPQHICPEFETPAYIQRNADSDESESHRARVHPLRLHPPSPSPVSSLHVQATTSSSQDVDLDTPKHTPSIITLLEDGAPFEASLSCSSACLYCRTVRLAKLDIDVAKQHNKSKDQDGGNSAGVQDPGVFHVGNITGDARSPQDVGYVEAMRRWYEERAAAVPGEGRGVLNKSLSG